MGGGQVIVLSRTEARAVQPIGHRNRYAESLEELEQVIARIGLPQFEQSVCHAALVVLVADDFCFARDPACLYRGDVCWVGALIARHFSSPVRPNASPGPSIFLCLILRRACTNGRSML